MAAKAPIWMLFAAAVLGGGIGALAVVAALPEPTSTPDLEMQQYADVHARLDELAAAVETQRKRTPRESRHGEVELVEPEAANAAQAPDSLPALGAAAPDSPEAAQAAALEEAVDELTRARFAKKEEERKKKREQQWRDLRKKLVEYGELLGLSDAQLQDIAEVRMDSLAEAEEARATEAPQEEIQDIERQAQAEFRRIMGEPTYREFNKIELDRGAGKIIANVASSAGVSDEQRRRMEDLLANHIEGVVDSYVRMRSEQLADDSKQRLREEIDAANQAAWNHLREDILTEEQRRRVPRRR